MTTPDGGQPRNISAQAGLPPAGQLNPYDTAHLPPLRLTFARWHNKRVVTGKDKDGFPVEKWVKKLAHTDSYAQFRYGTDTPSDWGRSDLQRCIICSRWSGMIAIDVDDEQAFMTRTRLGRIVGRQDAISTTRGGARFHILVDCRGVPPDLWPPSQGPVFGGDIKSCGFIPRPGSLHWSEELYEPVIHPGNITRILVATPELISAMTADRADCDAERRARANGAGGGHDGELAAKVLGWVRQAMNVGQDPAGPEVREWIYARWLEIAIPRDPDWEFDRDDFERHYRTAVQKALSTPAPDPPAAIEWAERTTQKGEEVVLNGNVIQRPAVTAQETPETWMQRFGLKSLQEQIDPESLLMRTANGAIDTYRTAEAILPRSDLLSGRVLAALAGDLLHYGTQYKQWLAWDDEAHVHAEDAEDKAGRLVQHYAGAHAEALRCIREQFEREAERVTGNLKAQKDIAKSEAARLAQGTDMAAAAKAVKTADLAAKAFDDMWAMEMEPYNLFKRHRAYRDKLWGHRTKSDVAGELRTLLATDMADFDSRPGWLVCDNGVVTVTDGPRFPLLVHDPSRLVTKRLGRGVVYDPRARCPAWEEFLASTVADDADRTFLQRHVGAALVGMQLKDFINIIGKGNTGKTTFNLVMKALFGSYFASPDVNVFMAAGDPQPWDLDLCRAARYVYASEPEPHSRFRDGMIKKLTGSDPVTSARKYGHPVTWDPQCLLVFATNDPIWFETSDAQMFGRAK
ncbi:MAG TPA: DUF5906 domain-containing protein, partial [Streptosporangiaceae bacterium]|nr:DUF5906 domain-containing protein [Streptosporangiaceae bacterium]